MKPRINTLLVSAIAGVSLSMLAGVLSAAPGERADVDSTTPDETEAKQDARRHHHKQIGGKHRSMAPTADSNDDAEDDAQRRHRHKRPAGAN